MNLLVGLSSSSNSNASLLNADNIGVIGIGSPAGNDVEGNAFTFSSVFSSAKRTWCFLLGVSSPLGFLSSPSLFIAPARISSGGGISIGSGNSGSSFPESSSFQCLGHDCFCIFISELHHHMFSRNICLRCWQCFCSSLGGNLPPKLA